MKDLKKLKAKTLNELLVLAERIDAELTIRTLKGEDSRKVATELNKRWSTKWVLEDDVVPLLKKQEGQIANLKGFKKIASILVDETNEKDETIKELDQKFIDLSFAHSDLEGRLKAIKKLVYSEKFNSYIVAKIKGLVDEE